MQTVSTHHTINKLNDTDLTVRRSLSRLNSLQLLHKIQLLNINFLKCKTISKKKIQNPFCNKLPNTHLFVVLAFYIWPNPTSSAWEHSGQIHETEDVKKTLLNDLCIFRGMYYEHQYDIWWRWKPETNRKMLSF